MKIAIPLDENREDICPSFGRAPFFFFSDNDQEEILPNPAADAQGGAGLQAAQFLLDQKVSVLITPRCGENAAQVLTSAEICIYKSSGVSAADNLASFRAGTLEKLTHFHAGFHGIA